MPDRSFSVRWRAWLAIAGLVVMITLCLLTSPAEVLAQPGQPIGVLHATVADALNRYVTGLTSNNFEVLESGSRRRVVSVSGPDDPIFIAVVNEHESGDLGSISGPAEVFETRSLTDALQRLAASTQARKALILTSPTQIGALPPGVFTTTADDANLRRVIIQICNEYAISFESTNSSAASEIILKIPVGLPPLKASIRK